MRIDYALRNTCRVEDLVKPLAIACITLYNEPLAELKSTIKSLITSIEDCFDHKTFSRKRIVFTIIADGIDKVDRELVHWLQHAGMINHGKATTDVWHTNNNLSRTSNLFSETVKRSHFDIGSVVYLKQKNKGKLHSHRLFFTDLCKTLEPNFIFQMDTGTIIKENALRKSIEYFEESPDVGAVCPQINVEEASLNSSFLHSWQFIDMAMQAHTWPAEEEFGHLSVIPGQFCALRWGALTNNPQDESEQCIIDLYLRGLEPKNVFEKILFLTEDRVIGSDMVLCHKEKWKICYAPDVIAVTDTCKSYGTLLRQRRRWENGATLGRLSFVQGVGKYLMRPDRTIMEKSAFLPACFWQLTTVVKTVISTALLMAQILFFVQDLSIQITSGHHFMAFLMPLLITAVAAGSAAGGSKYGDLLAKLSSISAWAFMLLWFYITRDKLAWILLMASRYIYVCALGFYYPKKAYYFALIWPKFFLLDTTLGITIGTYSMLRLGDVSWGTKDLTQGKLSENKYIYGIQIIWILITLFLLIATYGKSGILIDNLNPLLEIRVFLDLTVLAAAACYYLSYFFSQAEILKWVLVSLNLSKD